MKKPQNESLPTSRNVTEQEAERCFIKGLCESDHLFFARYFFKHRHGITFRQNWHHRLIADTIERVIRGELQNVIINVPPGSSKTELVAINFIARGLALNPRARFLHISYSDDLALLNSATAREIVQSDEYQALWPLKIADDANSKKRWNVEVDGHAAGGVYATSLGGQITGFRAGHMTEGFQGAVLIDDPLKVNDAYSKTMRERANRVLVSTVNSRRANPETPVIIIMQRLAEEDPTGFILAGGVPGDWAHVEIPALLDDATADGYGEPYADEIERGERDEQGRFSYWPYKEPVEVLAELERKDSFVFAGQYQQRPATLGGEIIHGAAFGRYTVAPRMRERKIFADTALKTSERNDYSVLQCWGIGADDGRLYLIDQIRGKWQAPELERRTLAFWAKHAEAGYPHEGALRELVIEDAASGTGLIQKIAQTEIDGYGRIPVRGTKPVRDKLTRVMDVLGYIESGYVMLPDLAPWLADFVTECEAFTADNTHAHDDQIDPMCYAISEMLARRSVLESFRDLDIAEFA
jgi:predicted phage terminase large subunit-like protein